MRFNATALAPGTLSAGSKSVSRRSTTEPRRRMPAPQNPSRPDSGARGTAARTGRVGLNRTAVPVDAQPAGAVVRDLPERWRRHNRLQRPRRLLQTNRYGHHARQGRQRVRHLRPGQRRAASGSLGATIALLALIVFASSAGATFPGKNGLITFSAGTGNGFQLYTVRPNGHHLHRITDLAGDAVNADWSPDGHQIVFELDHPTGEPFCSIDLIQRRREWAHRPHR
jgi:hypothetical protein